MAETGKKSRRFSFLMGLIILASFGIFWGLSCYLFRFAGDANQAEKKRVIERLEKLQSHREKDALTLENYGWVNEQEKVARIPVQRAMELQVERLKQKKLQSADPIQPVIISVPPLPQPTAKPGASK